MASSFAFDFDKVQCRHIIQFGQKKFHLPALVADPVLEVLGVGVALPVDVEPGVPDDVQVVADAPTELGGLLVFELEVEFPADPAQRREQPSR